MTSNDPAVRPVLASDALLLAIECAGAHASVALLRGERLLAERAEELGRGLSEKILPFIEDVLRQGGAGIEEVAAIGVGIGPGSFTGLRVGLATVKGIAAARPDLAVIAVGTLDALAFGVSGEGLVSPCLDARRGALYAGLFRVAGEPGPGRTIETLEPAEAVLAGQWAGRLAEAPGPVLFAGDGARALAKELGGALGPNFVLRPAEEHVPRARWVGELARREGRRGLFADAKTLIPLYLQNPRYERAAARDE